MSRLILSLMVAAGAAAFTPQAADAGCGGYEGGGYGGGYRTGYAYKHYTPVHRVYHRPVVHTPVVVHKPVIVHKPIAVAPVAEHCYHPQHCYVWVQPGESLDAICLREYGDASHWRRVAQYNTCTTLVVGQKLLLPSIYAGGRMIASTAPAPAPLATTPPAAALTAPPVAPAG